MANKEVLEKQKCPMCGNNTLTMMQEETEVPYFGKMFVFSMTCSNCSYHMADVEAAEEKPGTRFTFEVSSEEDLNVRLVKSSNAVVKIPHMITIEPGPVSIGYVSNIEGLLNRVKEVIESARDQEEDEAAKKKAKNMLKKLQRVMWGREKLKIILEDKTGNSAIISDKAVKENL